MFLLSCGESTKLSARFCVGADCVVEFRSQQVLLLLQESGLYVVEAGIAGEIFERTPGELQPVPASRQFQPRSFFLVRFSRHRSARSH